MRRNPLAILVGQACEKRFGDGYRRGCTFSPRSWAGERESCAGQIVACWDIGSSGDKQMQNWVGCQYRQSGVAIESCVSPAPRFRTSKIYISRGRVKSRFIRRKRTSQHPAGRICIECRIPPKWLPCHPSRLRVDVGSIWGGTPAALVLVIRQSTNVEAGRQTAWSLGKSSSLRQNDAKQS